MKASRPRFPQCSALGLFALALLAGAAPAPRTSSCSTFPTTRRASSTPRSTRPSPRSGSSRPARRSSIRASHGGSGKQARSVIDGLEADVVTLALAADIDAIATNGKLLPANWQSAPAAQQRAVHLDDRVPGAQGQSEGHQGLGRPGQARRRRDHAEPEDLRRRALELPRRVGVGLAASTATAARSLDFLTRLFKNVPVLDTGARGATTTFVERGIGDVLIAWENEALLTLAQADTRSKFEIVVPSLSIRAEPPVAWVDKNVDQHGTRKAGRSLPALPLHAGRPAPGRQAPLSPGRTGQGRRRRNWRASRR